MGYATWHIPEGLPTTPGRPMRPATWARLVEEGQAARLAWWEAHEMEQERYAATLIRLLGRHVGGRWLSSP
jgi:hypothetical protein